LPFIAAVLLNQHSRLSVDKCELLDTVVEVIRYGEVRIYDWVRKAADCRDTSECDDRNHQRVLNQVLTGLIMNELFHQLLHTATPVNLAHRDYFRGDPA
jgi:hypothetical protein